MNVVVWWDGVGVVDAVVLVMGAAMDASAGVDEGWMWEKQRAKLAVPGQQQNLYGCWRGVGQAYHSVSGWRPHAPPAFRAITNTALLAGAARERRAQSCDCGKRRAAIPAIRAQPRRCASPLHLQLYILIATLDRHHQPTASITSNTSTSSPAFQTTSPTSKWLPRPRPRPPPRAARCVSAL